ncbi:MAG: bifunctional DNA-formamidopyrimidine glycosylase/DNA-(apurinic or apyrimidinic site) lyase [Pseudomonadota bacterium]
MPELPEVETVRRGLEPAMQDATIVRLEQRRSDLRFPFPEQFAELLQGARITGLGRRAKYLIMSVESDSTLPEPQVVIMHLGMSGSFRVEQDDAANAPGVFHHSRDRQEKHDHVVFHLEKEGTTIRVIYNDPRRFGFMLMTPATTLHDHKLIRSIGVEPLGNELNAQLVATRFENKRTPLKAALLDQRIIAGLGNIYVCEALWRTGLSPRRLAGTLVKANGKPSPRLETLVDAVRQVLTEAIEAGGSSLRDHAQTDGTLGYFQHRFAAYDREGDDCAKPDCDGTISRITQSGRSTFFCPKCQR